jgi:hypothetical protein
MTDFPTDWWNEFEQLGEEEVRKRPSHSSAYTRTDGVPVDPLHQQATLAQCKGEAATTQVQIGNSMYGALEHKQKEDTIISACMARNGYIQQQQ